MEGESLEAKNPHLPAEVGVQEISSGVGLPPQALNEVQDLGYPGNLFNTVDVRGNRDPDLLFYRRKGLKSLLKDEWTIMDPSDREIGLIKEDSALMATLRRFPGEIYQDSLPVRAAITELTLNFRDPKGSLLGVAADCHESGEEAQSVGNHSVARFVVRGGESPSIIHVPCRPFPSLPNVSSNHPLGAQ